MDTFWDYDIWLEGPYLDYYNEPEPENTEEESAETIEPDPQAKARLDSKQTDSKE